MASPYGPVLGDLTGATATPNGFTGSTPPTIAAIAAGDGETITINPTTGLLTIAGATATAGAAGGVVVTDAGNTIGGQTVQTALGQTPILLSARFGQVINAADLGCKGDNATDNYPLINAKIGQFPANSTLFFPPSPEPYLFSQAVRYPSNIEVAAHPGTVTFMPTPNSTAGILLVYSELASNTLFYGITFDGGGTSFANTNSVLLCYKSTYIKFKLCTFQNSRGLLANMSDLNYSGFSECTFNNIGNYWTISKNSADRQECVAFSCDTQGLYGLYNYVDDSVFTNVGLDAVGATNCNYISVQRNRFYMTNNQFTLLPGSTNYPAAIFLVEPFGGVVSGNLIVGAAGNGIDTQAIQGLSISGNTVLLCGAAGISVAGGSSTAIPVTGSTVIGNVCMNNTQTQGPADGFEIYGGISIFSGASGLYINDLTVSGNTCTDNQTTKTQPYGIHCNVPTTITSLWIDQSNHLGGNITSDIGGTVGGVAVGYSISKTLPAIVTLPALGAYAQEWAGPGALQIMITLEMAPTTTAAAYGILSISPNAASNPNVTIDYANVPANGPADQRSLQGIVPAGWFYSISSANCTLVAPVGMVLP